MDDYIAILEAIRLDARARPPVRKNIVVTVDGLGVSFNAVDETNESG